MPEVQISAVRLVFLKVKTPQKPKSFININEENG